MLREHPEEEYDGVCDGDGEGGAAAARLLPQSEDGRELGDDARGRQRGGAPRRRERELADPLAEKRCDAL